MNKTGQNFIDLKNGLIALLKTSHLAKNIAVYVGSYYP
jgi:hypothetical protein